MLHRLSTLHPKNTMQEVQQSRNQGPAMQSVQQVSKMYKEWLQRGLVRSGFCNRTRFASSTTGCVSGADMTGCVPGGMARRVADCNTTGWCWQDSLCTGFGTDSLCTGAHGDGQLQSVQQQMRI